MRNEFFRTGRCTIGRQCTHFTCSMAMICGCCPQGGQRRCGSRRAGTAVGDGHGAVDISSIGAVHVCDPVGAVIGHTDGLVGGQPACRSRCHGGDGAVGDAAPDCLCAQTVDVQFGKRGCTDRVGHEGEGEACFQCGNAGHGCGVVGSVAGCGYDVYAVKGTLKFGQTIVVQVLLCVCHGVPPFYFTH